MKTGSHGPVQNARHAGYVDDIHSSGQHLLRVISEVLDLSKIDAGLEALHDERVALGFVATDCDRLLRSGFEGAGLDLNVDLPSLDRERRFDRTKLSRTLLNLLGNALKFTPRGGRVDLLALLREDGGLDIMVRDNGIGMSPAELAIAISAFGQVNIAVRRRNQGTGLGLPIVKSLVELHGGSLHIASSPGVGTTVTVAVPADRVVAATAAQTLPPAETDDAVRS